jgi:dephospho-CoA kinase
MSKPCLVIGITGGIATGKSSFARSLHQCAGGRLFDADKAARELTEKDPEVQEALRAEFGKSIFFATGGLNRAALRGIIYADTNKKRALEQILHPRIRRQWATEAETSRQDGEIFLADIPLLYETEGETICDRVVVVACSGQIQQERLVARSALSLAEARSIIASQMSLSEKISRADHLAWNNGPQSILESQAATFANFLTSSDGRRTQ